MGVLKELIRTGDRNVPDSTPVGFVPKRVASYLEQTRNGGDEVAYRHFQSALVHVNTLLVDQVLSEPQWAARMTDEDRRALTALFWSNINPYGVCELDMSTRFGPDQPRHHPSQRRRRTPCFWDAITAGSSQPQQQNRVLPAGEPPPVMRLHPATFRLRAKMGVPGLVGQQGLNGCPRGRRRLGRRVRALGRRRL